MVDVHGFWQRVDPCAGRIVVPLVKGAGFAADIEGAAVRGDPA
ncbi:hypothetical protein ACFU8Q_20910 [Streptomyces sp. NPDC057543]